MEGEKVSINLTKAEALVLYEWLSRADDAQKLPIDHPAEQTVLWTVEGQLEKQIRELFDPNYKAIVEAARQEVSKGN